MSSVKNHRSVMQIPWQLPDLANNLLFLPCVSDQHSSAVQVMYVVLRIEPMYRIVPSIG